jgi:hypothetical protein
VSDSDGIVTLTAGLTVPLLALQVLWSLENRGLRLNVDGDWLMVGPREKLNDDDREAIRRWRSHLLALIAYQPGRVQ